MTNKEAKKILRDSNQDIEMLAGKYYQEMLELIKEGETPREAIRKTTETFHNDYFESLAFYFSLMLEKEFTVKQIKRRQINKITLSQRLYNNLEDVEKKSLKIINDYNKTKKTIKSLARKLYDGYSIKEDPLNVKESLPKYLIDDIENMQDRLSSRPKTPSLRNAYEQALRSANDMELQKNLEIAIKEKSRYYANRISQNEMWRSYSENYFDELIDDNEVNYVKISLSPTHVITDICDVHTRRNPIGLGAGIYLKSKAPVPTFHPFCKCELSPYYTDKKPNEEKDNISSILRNKQLKKQVDYFGLKVGKGRFS